MANIKVFVLLAIPFLLAEFALAPNASNCPATYVTLDKYEVSSGWIVDEYAAVDELIIVDGEVIAIQWHLLTGSPAVYYSIIKAGTNVEVTEHGPPIIPTNPYTSVTNGENGISHLELCKEEVPTAITLSSNGVSGKSTPAVSVLVVVALLIVITVGCLYAKQNR